MSSRVRGVSVSATVDQVEIEAAFRLLGRSAGIEVVQLGGVWYFGESASTDLPLFARRVRRLDKDELGEAIKAAGSETNSTHVSVDGFVTVVDKPEAIDRIANLLEILERAESVTWLVQVYLTSASDRTRERIIGAVSPVLALELQSGSLSATAELLARLEAEASAVSGAFETRPLIVVGDGREGRLFEGSVRRVRDRTIDERGTERENGFTEVEAGTEIVAACREVAADRVNLSLSVTLGSVVGDSLDTVTTEFSTESELDCSRVYLLGRLRRHEREKSRSHWLRFGKDWFDGSSELAVWVRVQRIGRELSGAVSESAKIAELEKRRHSRRVLVLRNVGAGSRTSAGTNGSAPGTDRDVTESGGGSEISRWPASDLQRDGRSHSAVEAVGEVQSLSRQRDAYAVPTDPVSGGGVPLGDSAERSGDESGAATKPGTSGGGPDRRNPDVSSAQKKSESDDRN